MTVKSFSKISFIVFQICINIVIQIFPGIKYLKYIFMSVCFLPVLIMAIINNKTCKSMHFMRQLIIMTSACLFLSILSVIRMFQKNAFNVSFVEETLFTILPVITTWAYISYDEEVDFDFYINAFFVFTIINFFIRFYKIFTFSNILSVSFGDSYSPFESELVNIFLPLTFYYLFVNKSLWKAVFASFFCWLSMKRIHELFLVFYWFVFIIFCIFPTVKRWAKGKKTGYFFELLLCMGLTLFPVLLNFGLNSDFFNRLTEKYLHLSFNAFTLGRENMYKTVYEHLNLVAGWGNTRPLCLFLWGNNDMHSDLLRVYYEIGYLGLVAFIFAYIKMCDRNLMAFLLFGFVVCNMIISPIITDSFGFVCIYLVMYSTIYKRENNLKTPIITEYADEKQNVVSD